MVWVDRFLDKMSSLGNKGISGTPLVGQCKGRLQLGWTDRGRAGLGQIGAKRVNVYLPNKRVHIKWRGLEFESHVQSWNIFCNQEQSKFPRYMSPHNYVHLQVQWSPDVVIDPCSDNPAVVIEFLGPDPSCSCSLWIKSGCSDIFQSGYSESPSRWKMHLNFSMSLSLQCLFNETLLLSITLT